MAPGAQFTVQPDGDIQPICQGFAELYVATSSDDLVSSAQLGNGVFVERSETTPTWPACLPPKSDQPATFIVPAALVDGSYIVCITPALDPAGCGALDVQGDH